MAYFPNGESGYIFEDKYCVHCVHFKEVPGGNGALSCPILDLHYDWNYEQCKETEEGKEKERILSSFIPMREDGLWPEACVMFVEDEGKPDPNQTDLDL